MSPPPSGLPERVVRPWLRRLFPRHRGRPRIEPLAADASTRRYFRVRWPAPDPKAPPSCVLMRCEPWAASDRPDFLTVGDHLRDSGVRVPQVYGTCPPHGLMCLEDWGDRTLAAHWHDTSADDRRRWGLRAIDELVKVHTVATQHRSASCPAFQLAFDVPKLLSELQFFRQHALVDLWQQPLTAADMEALDAAFLPLCERLAAAPRYFCHRDYHAWNLMVFGDDLGLLDFQDARMGPQPYDLVSLLFDRGTPELLGEEVSQALVTAYVTRWQAESGQALDVDQFTELYELAAVQRGLKAIGTFAAMQVVYGRSHYQAYIPPTLAAIRPLLRRHERLRPLARLLRRYLPSASV